MIPMLYCLIVVERRGRGRVVFGFLERKIILNWWDTGVELLGIIILRR